MKEPEAFTFKTYAKKEGKGCSEEEKGFHEAGFTWFTRNEYMAFNMPDEEDNDFADEFEL